MRAKHFTPVCLAHASVVTGLVLMALMVSACGSQQYQNIATTQQAAAPGSMQISPKIDVVLVEDDTGDMLDGDYSQITNQVQTMMTNLGSENWNYHFTTLHMTKIAALTQAVSSKQDPNWANAEGGSQWVAPYPGAIEGSFYSNPPNEDALNPDIFYTFTAVPGFPEYSGFVQYGDVNNSQAGAEPGLYSTLQNFGSSFNGMGFLRPDALLAVVFVGMGNDTSYVNQCMNGNQQVPCDDVYGVPACTSLSQSAPSGENFTSNEAAGVCASGALSMNYFENQMRAVKQSSSQLKVYAAVPASNSLTSGTLCQNGYGTPGTRYTQFAGDLGGQSYDVCSQSLSSILTDVAQNLTTTALDYVTGYLLVGTANQTAPAPNPSTIQVVEYPGGNTSNPVTIPQDPTNGWTYVGYVTEPTIISPVPMDTETGYMIQLNGSAQLSGADSASVTFTSAN